MRASYHRTLACLLIFLVWPSVLIAQSQSSWAGNMVITNVQVYASPTFDSVARATIVIKGGKIAEIVPGVPEDLDPALVHLDGRGRTVVAGFWNSHVHFSPPLWVGLEKLEEKELVRRLRSMLSNYGFTSVVDTGSNPFQTQWLRQQIADGLPGPEILMAAGSFVGKDSSPAYLDIKLPELTTPEQASEQVAEVLELGSEGIKIFTGSFIGPGKVGHMTLPVVKAVTSVAHKHGKWVISHPQSLEGVRLAADGGVDILAHTAPDAGPWPKQLIDRLVSRNVALIPTLQLWRFELTRAGVAPQAVESFQQIGVEQVRAFVEAGGEVLFGTDVGYMQDFDPTEEYLKMSQAGMSWRQILASLTTVPAKRFGRGTGTLAVGQPANLVVLSRDPSQDATAFAAVDVTIRGGYVIAGVSM